MSCGVPLRLLIVLRLSNDEPDDAIQAPGHRRMGSSLRSVIPSVDPPKPADLDHHRKVGRSVVYRGNRSIRVGKTMGLDPGSHGLMSPQPRGPLPPRPNVPISQRICQGILVTTLIASIILCAIYLLPLLLSVIGIAIVLFILTTAVYGPPW